MCCHFQEKPDATHASALFSHGAAVFFCLACAGQPFNNVYYSRTLSLARIHVPILSFKTKELVCLLHPDPQLPAPFIWADTPYAIASSPGVCSACPMH